MEVRLIVLTVLFVSVLLFFLIPTIVRLRERRIVPHRHAWLPILNHSEWKRDSEIRKEMQCLKKTRSHLYVMDLDLAGLEEERLIESRILFLHCLSLKTGAHHVIAVVEYRITQNGVRKRLERLESRQDLAGEERDFQPVSATQ